MKKITLLSLAFILVASIANAQIQKGSIFLGGSLNFSSDKSNLTSTNNSESINSNWAMRPQIGKVFSNNKIAGVFLNTGGSQNKQTSAPSNLSQTKGRFYGGGFFFRNYFPIIHRFYLFGDASLGFSFDKSESLIDNGTTRYVYSTSKTWQPYFSLVPGISFAATQKVHIEAAFSNLLSLSYNSTKSKEFSSPGTLYRETDSKSLRASANANGFNNIYLGIRFIIP